MYKISLKNQQTHLGVWMQLYYTVITEMFHPFMWPSSGWRREEYKWNYVCIVFLSSKPLRWPHEWLKHVGDYHVIKLHSYTQVHFFYLFKHFYAPDQFTELGTYRIKWKEFLKKSNERNKVKGICVINN